MKRPSRDEVLMESAMLWAPRGTCGRASVGCVVSREGRILSTGYNGAPSRMPHCNHSDSSPCTNVVHAEANAIAFAAKHGVGTLGSELHTTRIPCTNCAGIVINAGITRVVWYEEHRDMGGLVRLGEAGLEVIRYRYDN